MREILFRGKRIDNGEWIEGFFFQIWERTYILWGTTNGAPNMIEVDPSTVGQYTGLTDKNGKKIFEGDIVRHGYTCKYSDGKTADFYSNMPVSFSNHYGGWIVGVQGILTIKTVQKYNIEVIGNVHDNPELLGGAE